MNIPYLVIEVTRKCNIRCDHCLRGDAQKSNMNLLYIDSLLNQVEEIGTVVFSGGEPSMAVGVIEYFLTEVKRRGIGLGSFYIATNGIEVSEDFIMVCLKLYSYSYEKSYCKIDVSNDMFHQAEGGYNTELLDGLAFIGRKYEKEGYDFDNRTRLINEGRGSNYNTKNKAEGGQITTVEEFRDTQIYLNCKGNIISGCDWSYKSQDKPENILCQVDSFQQFYDLLEVEE